MNKGIGGILVILIMIASVAAVVPMAMGGDVPPNGDGGFGTPGYWKNHPEAWPVQTITIDGVLYTQADAIAIMNNPGKGDKTYDIFRALVAFNLNVLSGNNGEPLNILIENAANNAVGWMANNQVGSGVKANSDAWKIAEPWYEDLDAYNNGLL